MGAEDRHEMMPAASSVLVELHLCPDKAPHKDNFPSISLQLLQVFSRGFRGCSAKSLSAHQTPNPPKLHLWDWGCFREPSVYTFGSLGGLSAQGGGHGNMFTVQSRLMERNKLPSIQKTLLLVSSRKKFLGFVVHLPRTCQLS